MSWAIKYFLVADASRVTDAAESAAAGIISGVPFLPDPGERHVRAAEPMDGGPARRTTVTPGRRAKRSAKLPTPSQRSTSLIIDEIGYVEFDKKASTWLFQLLCQRYERRSTIITSNKAFAEWGEIFGDPILAAAMLDRYLHHCHVFNLKGESYRMRSRNRGLSANKGQKAPRVGPP